MTRHPLRLNLVVAIALATAGPAAVSASAAGPARLSDGAHRSTPCPLRLPARLPARAIVVPILMYHRIDVVRPATPLITRRLTVDPEDFAAQMRWLKRHRYHTLTQQQLFAALACGSRLPRRPVMITFDDGYRDVFFKASTTLLRLGMHATAYVITGRISGPDPSFLTWPLLHALERRGIEIGSHTVSHGDLTSLSAAAATDELVRSRRTLERALHHPVPWLAYPAGRFDEDVVRLARKAGYILAVTTQERTTLSSAAPLELGRLRILDSTGVDGLAAMLATAARR